MRAQHPSPPPSGKSLPVPADPVTCTHCEQVVCDARAADSLIALLEHDCPEGRSTGGPYTIAELLADLYPPQGRR
jgi:hypothetical protein